MPCVYNKPNTKQFAKSKPLTDKKMLELIKNNIVKHKELLEYLKDK